MKLLREWVIYTHNHSYRFHQLVFNTRQLELWLSLHDQSCWQKIFRAYPVYPPKSMEVTGANRILWGRIIRSSPVKSSGLSGRILHVWCATLLYFITRISVLDILVERTKGFEVRLKLLDDLDAERLWCFFMASDNLKKNRTVGLDSNTKLDLVATPAHGLQLWGEPGTLWHELLGLGYRFPRLGWLLGPETCCEIEDMMEFCVLQQGLWQDLLP